MHITNFTKNKKQEKNRKSHINSILSQVKNKVLIQQIDNQKKFNQMNISISDKLNKSTLSQKNRQQRNSSKFLIKKTQSLTMEKSNMMSIQDTTLQSFPKAEINQFREIGKPCISSRRNSKLQFKLEQITKYSKMYPGRRDSKEYINKNIQQLLGNNKFSIRNKFTENSSENQSRLHPIKEKSSRFSQKSNPKAEKKAPINRKYLLDILPLPKKLLHQIGEEVENSFSSQSENQFPGQLPLKKQNVKRILEALQSSKKHCERNFPRNDLSLDTIIENQLTSYQNRHERKTSPALISEALDFSETSFAQFMNKPISYVRRNQQLSLENEKVANFNKFISGGGALDEDDFGDYIYESDISKFQNHFDIYKRICDEMIKKIKYERISPLNVQEQNLKSALFLHQGLKHSKTIQIKKQFKQAMKRIRMINTQSNF